ncbi:MAG: ion channel [Alphaproteobacteria bacterium]|uniref:ion channel n=1 Tax=Aestuariivirga sp. TaxID=2650926 RepID=UPI00301870B8|nr:ion channel [Alphaproteobacteria bacterium]
MDTSTDIFNWPALVVGCAALLACMCVQGSTVALVMGRLKPRLRVLATQKRSVLAHLLFFTCVVILLISHLAQILIWSQFIYWPGAMTNPHSAVLFAGSTYTTVGFSNDNLPRQWQLLAVIMAVTGLFAFAWSTSILYALSQQIYRNED